MGKEARSVPLDHVIPADADELGLGGSGLMAVGVDHLERELAAAADLRGLA